MSRFVDWIRAAALTLGAPGLLVVAFLDSSFLPLPGIADVLLVVMVTRHRAGLAWYVAAATVGSIGGCLVLHYLGRKGGEALVRKRFTGARVERARSALQRHGVMAVLVPSILPPPAPFKMFVLLAGVVGIRPVPFATAIAIGRGARYLALGLLALTYGDRATAYVRENGAFVSLVVVGVLLAGFVAYLLWRKARAGKGR
jgi:membrane protein YqaA with SNARE-associated domain